MRPIVSALSTDLYQLTMLQCYHLAGMREVAVFDLFVRRLPRDRNFLVAAGLEQVLDLLESLRFTPEELAWLAECGHLRSDFVEHLAQWRFMGDVNALPEGTIFFAGEPVLRITAPIEQAQLVESRLLNMVHFQTMIASKAVRSVLAARGKPIVDFGFRRATAPKPVCWPPGLRTWRALPAPRRSRPRTISASPCSAPWPIRWCRPSATIERHS